MSQEFSPKLRGIFLLGLLVVLAVAGKVTWQDAPPPAEQPTATEQVKPERTGLPTTSSRSLPVAEPLASPSVSINHETRKSVPEKAVVRGVEVRDLRGRVVFRGDVDLSPTLERIAAGKHFPHRNDGAVFNNYPLPGRSAPLLPKKARDYYHEYVQPTPGISGPGPQRVILGQTGEIYYTPDHYNSFTKVRAGP